MPWSKRAQKITREGEHGGEGRGGQTMEAGRRREKRNQVRNTEVNI